LKNAVKNFKKGARQWNDDYNSIIEYWLFEFLPKLISTTWAAGLFFTNLFLGFLHGSPPPWIETYGGKRQNVDKNGTESLGSPKTRKE
jgi:hypothetical protein